MKKNSEFLSGVRDGVPIALAYFAVSFALGITAGKIGFSAIQAFVASLTNNASAGEYAAFSLIAVGSSFLEVAIVELITNARYFLMAATLSQKFSGKFYHRLFIGFGLTDEIFAINVARNGYLVPSYTYGAMAVALPSWATGTALGVIVGDVLPAFAVSALGVALYGMFISIIVPPATKDKTLAVTVLISFALSTLSEKLPFLSTVSSGIKMIILTVAISLVAAIVKPVPTEQAEK